MMSYPLILSIAYCLFTLFHQGSSRDISKLVFNSEPVLHVVEVKSWLMARKQVRQWHQHSVGLKQEPLMSRAGDDNPTDVVVVRLMLAFLERRTHIQ